MSISELLQQGLNLMLLGMGSVFIFLGLLILMMTLVARVASKWPEPAEREGASRPSARPASAAAEESDDEVIAVISAAVARYRAGHAG